MLLRSVSTKVRGFNACRTFRACITGTRSFKAVDILPRTILYIFQTKMKGQPQAMRVALIAGHCAGHQPGECWACRFEKFRVTKLGISSRVHHRGSLTIFRISTKQASEARSRDVPQEQCRVPSGFVCPTHQSPILSTLAALGQSRGRSEGLGERGTPARHVPNVPTAAMPMC